MKTDGSERYAVVDEETTMLLQEYIKITKEIAKRAGRILSQNDFIFLNDGHHFMSQLGEPAAYTRLGVNFKRVSEHSNIWRQL